MFKLSDLEMALEFNSSVGFDSDVYLDTESFETIYVSDEVDEEPPEDIDENERYILLPKKSDFDLGRNLAIDFAQDNMSDEMVDDVYSIFRSKGAYARFKHLLDRTGLLEQWYQYELDRTQEALQEWCKENGLQVK